MQVKLKARSRSGELRGFCPLTHRRRPGQRVPGPGRDFFKAVRKELGALPFIAEDLGLITPDVYSLRDEFQVPGTRVLQFAFDGHADNPYLPNNYVPNTEEEDIDDEEDGYSE